MTKKEQLEIAKLKLDIQISQVTLDEQRHPWRKISLMQPFIAMVVGVGTLVATSAISVLDHQDRRRGAEKQTMQVTDNGEHTQRQLDGLEASSAKIQKQLETLQNSESRAAISSGFAPPTSANEILTSHGASVDPQLGMSLSRSENAIGTSDTSDEPLVDKRLVELASSRLATAIEAHALAYERNRTYKLTVSSLF